VTRVSAAQIEVNLGQPRENVARARRLIAAAKADGAELVLLPELWSSGYALPQAGEFGSAIDAGVFSDVSAMAQDHGIFVCGSLIEASAGRFFNTQVIYGPDGKLVASYQKTHLFRGMDEDKFLSAGDRLITASLPWTKAGLAICYDLRFPQMFRSYSSLGTELFLISAEWPQPRLDHWRALLVARAIENQSFVVACNCVGENSQDRFGGHSMVVDPWGKILAEAGDQEELISADLDFSLVANLRCRYPVLADQRPELYEPSRVTGHSG
jgi:predicted amidohydrolase